MSLVESFLNRRIGVGFVLVAALSCGRKPDKSALDSNIAAIQVRLDAPRVLVGFTTQANAALADDLGNPVNGVGVGWYSSNPKVANVDPASGVVTAIGPGVATIVATVQGQSGSTRLVVGTTERAATVIADSATHADSVQARQPKVAQASTSTIANGSAPSAAPISAQPDPSGRRVSHDFNDGTFGPFVNSTPGHNAIVDDPTGSDHGKVVRIRYEGSGSKLDLNQYFQYEPPGGLSEAHFAGDFYFPANTVRYNFPNVQRKLIYWRVNPASRPHGSFLVVHLWGETVELEYGDGVGSDVVARDLGQARAGVWHHLEIDTKFNSRYSSKDGIIRIRLDGVSLFDKHDISLTSPTWTYPSPPRFDWFGIGYQREGTDIISSVPEPAIDEVRYWDNIVFTPNIAR